MVSGQYPSVPILSTVSMRKRRIAPRAICSFCAEYLKLNVLMRSETLGGRCRAMLKVDIGRSTNDVDAAVKEHKKGVAIELGEHRSNCAMVVSIRTRKVEDDIECRG